MKSLCSILLFEKYDINHTRLMPHCWSKHRIFKLNNLNIMKKHLLAGILVCVLSCGFAYAGKGKEVSKEVKETFCKEFINAVDVRWEISNDYVKATFLMDDQALSAYFHNDGELFAVTRSILSNQLPIQLLIKLKDEYIAYWITDLIEVYSHDESSYFVTLRSSTKELVLKSDGGERWALVHSEKHRNSDIP